MKQGKNTAAAFDLDDLERELQLAAAPRKTSVADDPLAELARIVGQETGKGGAPGRGGFADFLSAPPQPVSGPMPSATPPIEPLFADGFRHIDRPQASAAAPAAEPAPAPAPKALDPLEALLAQDLGLRSGLDELPEPKLPDPPPPEVRLPDPKPVEREDDPFASLDALLADELRGIDAHQSDAVPAEAPATADAAAEFEDAGSVGASADADALSGSPASAAEITAAPQPAAVAPPIVSGPAAKFDDMMAEFEAAMRDVGTPAVARPIEPQAVEPPPLVSAPPGDIVVPMQPEPRAAAAERTLGEAGMVAGAAGAAVIGAAAVAQAARPRRGLMLAGGAIAVAVIGLGALAMFGGGSSSRQQQTAGNVPVIAAKPGVTKERPANPGGVEVPNQDKEILQTRPSAPQQAERVAPREEQPVDLTQAQRQAAAGGQVRQIPGVAIVAPVSTTPPAGAAAAPPVETSPRPVASVPITSAGQPTPSIAPSPLPAPQPSLAVPTAAPAPPAAAQPPAPPAPLAPAAPVTAPQTTPPTRA
ncbi:MAG: hypothetical protein ACRCTI_00220, partial [Beijerinckiaceae bacterium]